MIASVNFVTLCTKQYYNLLWNILVNKDIHDAAWSSG